MLARVLAALGRSMITAGVLILLFVAYQLWGTGIRTAQAQDDLADDLAAQLADAESATVSSSTSSSSSTSTTSRTSGSSTTSTSTTSTSTAGSTTPTSRRAATTTTRPPTTVPPLPAELLPAPGEAAGRIVIERIGVDYVFVEGVGVADLKKGPGHYPETPLPGQAGNAAIAGHRTTYGAPFSAVDELRPGDEIRVTTVQGTFIYEVRATEIVSPSQVEVLQADHWGWDNALTLTACHPKYSARQRIIVGAELVGAPAPTTPSGDDRRRPGDAPPADPGDATTPVAFEDDLSGEDSAGGPAVAWGAACAGIWLLAWAAGKRWRRAKWAAYGVGFLPFLVALFFFFEEFSRLLPANY